MVGHLAMFENEFVLLSLIDEVMLWGEENVRQELGDPSREQDNKIVVLLFVHNFHDCIELCCNGCVVSMSPIGHEVILQAVCIKYNWATSYHDTAIMLQQVAVYVCNN